MDLPSNGRRNNKAKHCNDPNPRVIEVNVQNTLEHILDVKCNNKPKNSEKLDDSEAEIVPIISSVDLEDDQDERFNSHPVEEMWVFGKTKTAEAGPDALFGNLPPSCSNFSRSCEVVGGEYLNPVHSIARQGGGEDGVQGQEDFSQVPKPAAVTPMVKSKQVLPPQEPVKCYLCELGRSRLSRTIQARVFTSSENRSFAPNSEQEANMLRL